MTSYKVFLPHIAEEGAVVRVELEFVALETDDWAAVATLQYQHVDDADRTCLCQECVKTG